MFRDFDFFDFVDVDWLNIFAFIESASIENKFANKSSSWKSSEFILANGILISAKLRTGIYVKQQGSAKKVSLVKYYFVFRLVRGKLIQSYGWC